MGPNSAPKSKSVCEYFFQRDDDVSWRCRKCNKTKAKSGGWTNLLSHLRSCVGKEYEAIYNDHQKMIATTSSKVVNGYFVRISEREKEVAKWMEFIVMKNLPVSFVNCPYTRDIARLKHISAQTLRGHILDVLSLMQEAIQEELPAKFSIVFDGWTEGTQHYIGVAAAYMKSGGDGKEQPVQTMLSMKPLLAEGVQGMRACDHIDHVERVLQVYGKTTDNILCLVGDNCSVNQSMARILGIPLIGCASHKFNLAVRQWIAQQAELTPILKKVRTFVQLYCLALLITNLTNPLVSCRSPGGWRHEKSVDIEDCSEAAGPDQLLCRS